MDASTASSRLGHSGSAGLGQLMTVSLNTLFETIGVPTSDDMAKPLYAVLPVPGYQSYFIGKDRDSRACLLVATIDDSQRQPSPIRLESLDVQFELPCRLKKERELAKNGRFTVIRCRSLDGETVRYFLSVCEVVLRTIGDNPARREIASAVHRLAVIFQKTQKPPARTVNGLFGELYLLSRSSNPARALTAWRIDDAARFDFVDGDVRLDVKTTSSRERTHIFSYEQCNPPPGTIAVAASMFVERVSRGISLRSLLDHIAEIVGPQIDLALKLHEVTAATLGTSLNESMSLSFDGKLAESSLRFFNLTNLPAIRGPLPAGVSGVRFRSDLSMSNAISIADLIDLDPVFSSLLPKRNEI